MSLYHAIPMLIAGAALLIWCWIDSNPRHP